MSIVPVEMRIELLGPLSVYINDLPITPDAAKPRQVIALLALNSGHAVTVGTLMQELWGEEPPPSASQWSNNRTVAVLNNAVLNSRVWASRGTITYEDQGSDTPVSGQ